MTSSFGLHSADDAIALSLRDSLRAFNCSRQSWKLASKAPNNLRQSLANIIQSEREATVDEALNSLLAVTHVDPRLRGKHCLPRSIAAVLYADKKYGARVKLVIGARVEPFLAHAWVQTRGEAVGESGSVQYLEALLEI